MLACWSFGLIGLSQFLQCSVSFFFSTLFSGLCRVLSLHSATLHCVQSHRKTFYIPSKSAAVHFANCIRLAHFLIARHSSNSTTFHLPFALAAFVSSTSFISFAHSVATLAQPAKKTTLHSKKLRQPYNKR